MTSSAATPPCRNRLCISNWSISCRLGWALLPATTRSRDPSVARRWRVLASRCDGSDWIPRRPTRSHRRSSCARGGAWRVRGALPALDLAVSDRVQRGPAAARPVSAGDGVQPPRRRGRDCRGPRCDRCALRVITSRSQLRVAVRSSESRSGPRRRGQRRRDGGGSVVSRFERNGAITSARRPAPGSAPSERSTCTCRTWPPNLTSDRAQAPRPVRSTERSRLSLELSHSPRKRSNPP
jgi:hypothetical protein